MPCAIYCGIAGSWSAGRRRIVMPDWGGASFTRRLAPAARLIYDPIHDRSHRSEYMQRMMVLVASSALVLGLAVSISAQSKKGQPKAAAGSPETVVYDAAAAMAFLTTTSGDWVSGSAQHEHGGAAPAGNRPVVSVKTKAAGSAVVHTYAQGTPGEMETIF